jgi:hypothetical protein
MQAGLSFRKDFPIPQVYIDRIRSFQLSWANGGFGKKFKIYIVYEVVILKVRNLLLCTVSRGPLYVKACSPGSWD